MVERHIEGHKVDETLDRENGSIYWKLQRKIENHDYFDQTKFFKNA